MVPFVLNDFVSGPVAANIPYDQPGCNRALYFNKVELVKPTAFASTPDLGDGVVYTDEHMAFMKSKFATDITRPAPARALIVGIDNEPDLYHCNFPMLQEGSATSSRCLAEPTERAGRQARHRRGVHGAHHQVREARAKTIARTRTIIGPSHYHFDGFTTWHQLENVEFDHGHWYMDDFLAGVKAESDRTGVRLLDTWDFHWYPQPVINGTYVSALDNAARTMTRGGDRRRRPGPA